MAGFDPFSLAIGATTSGIKAGIGLFQNIKANKINPQRVDYMGSKSVGDQLATVKQLYNSRGAGFAAAQDKIAQSQANTLASGARNATDSASLLALAQGSQDQSDNALVDLATRESQAKVGMLDNLQAAYDKMTQDDRMIYQDKLSKYQDDVAAKSALRNAGIQNMIGGVSDAASLSMQNDQMKQLRGMNKFSQFGGFGDFSKLAMIGK
jgi:hypothetical protein